MKLKKIDRILFLLFIFSFLFIFTRNIWFSFKPIFAWDMIPRFSISQVIDNTLYLWDPYINRPNFRAIQSFISIWMLYYKVQWFGIIVSYTLLILSMYLFFKEILELTGNSSRGIFKELSIFVGVVPSTSFILISEGFWYHSIVLSISFMILEFYFTIKYIYKKSNRKYLIAILLLSAFNPMISYNYICLILILMLYLIIKLKKIFVKKYFCFYKEDKVVLTSLIGFLLYLLRVVVPTLSSSVKALEYELDIKIAKLSPIEAMIPIIKISYFYNLKRFEDYLIGNPKLVIFYIFPILTLITFLLIYKKLKNKEIYLWLGVVLIFSIFSAQASGFYSIAYLLGKTFNAMNLYETVILPLRKPTKWLLVLAVVYGVYLSLLTSSVVENVQKKLKLIIAVFLFILIIIPFSLYPFNMVFSGDLGGALHPVNIPDEYYVTKKVVNKDNGVLIFPIHIERPSLAIENRKTTDEFFNYFYNKISYEAGGFDSYPYNVKYLGLIYSSIVLGKTTNVGNLLTPLGISSIILDKSVSYTIPYATWSPKLFSNNEIENLVSNIDKQKDLRLTFETKHLKVYKNNKITSTLYIPAKVLLNYLDYRVFYSLSLLISFRDYALLGVDSKTKNLELADFIVLPYNNPAISILSSSSEGYLITTDNIEFNNKWESYKLAYIGMSELSRYYRLYDHLGFPSYSTYSMATKYSEAQLHVSKKVSNGHYKVLARVFGSGTIKISLNSNSRSIDINSKYLTLIDLGDLKVQNNSADIKIKVVKGSLVFDCIYLVNDSTLLKLKNKLKKKLQSKTIIYLFEAESDLYRSNARIIKNANFSNGKALLFLKNGRAWQEIDIIKNGTYMIALKGYGIFKVKIGSHEFVLKPNSNFAYSPLFNLTEGKYELEIVPLSKAPKLDVIWLYSTKTPKTLQQLFEVKKKPAKIISYEKINPTLWKVKINAREPFMLSFAEAYDPLWEARVYKNGKLIEKVKSIPLYSVINGFWINETGNLTIVIRYLPQDWFELGLKISAFTFIGCIGYLFYDWRRKKN